MHLPKQTNFWTVFVKIGPIYYLYQNTAKTLQVEWPDGLKSGQEYRLEVRTAVRGGKQVRTGSSAKPLKVK